MIDLIHEWGVLVSWSPHTGVWVGKRNIYAMGAVHNSSMVNDCDTDLEWFDNIVPCGIKGAGLISLTEQVGKEWLVEVGEVEGLPTG